MKRIIYKPRFSIYWSTDTLLSTPVFSQIMTKDKFLCLIHSLHFADNTQHNPANKPAVTFNMCGTVTLGNKGVKTCLLHLKIKAGSN